MAEELEPDFSNLRNPPQIERVPERDVQEVVLRRIIRNGRKRHPGVSALAHLRRVCSRSAERVIGLKVHLQILEPF